MKTLDRFQGVSPVLLSSSCTVKANNSAIPDSGQLSYPFRKAIVIEEIRWTMSSELVGGKNLGALVATKLSIGQLYLMRDPMPVWLLGTMMDQSLEDARDFSTAPASDFGHYRWRLPEPLYLEAGQVLSSWFTRGDDGLGDIDVQVSYVGKTVAPSQPKPGLIAVPYAAPFVTTLGQVYQQSNEFNLFNPFDVPIRVQRLTGRVLKFAPPFVSAAMALTPAVPGSGLTILMNDSWGGKMVNNNTGPGDVFDVLRAAWTVDTIMPPKGVYEVRAWNIPADLQLHVGLIGVREERI